MRTIRVLLPVVVFVTGLLLSSHPVSALPAPPGEPARFAAQSPAEQQEEEREPGTYVVQQGDTLSHIAQEFGVPVATLVEVNELASADSVRVGQVLMIPGSDGSLPEMTEEEQRAAAPAPVAQERGSLQDHMTLAARRAAIGSPFHRTTWVTYYGRPNVFVMGILGEYSIDELVPVLREQAAAYDEANGPDMDVMPAFHLVHGMATRAPGDNGSHLAYLRDSVVMEYIERGKEEGFGVILDIQVGSLTPLEAMEQAFQYLHHENVHLALDPEFAMVHPGQEVPGNPIGFVTAEEVNEVQYAMRDYMRANGIKGRKFLIVHQFQNSMIVDKPDIRQIRRIDLVVTADGFGGPWAKISKYNNFMDETVQFAGFKLFYRWDTPVLSERVVLGVEPYPGLPYMEVTPNLIIYQ